MIDETTAEKELLEQVAIEAGQKIEVLTNIQIIDDGKTIRLTDNTDEYNMPAGFNTKVRGIKKVIKYIQDNRSELERQSMYKVIQRLEAIADLSFHTYCRMD